MIRNVVCRFVLLAAMLLAYNPYGLAQYASEEELKAAAEKYFEEDNFKEALPLYSQLLALYPKDANYNYKLGASMLFADKDKEAPLKYLEFAASKPDVDAEAHYYLGKAYHLNYEFGMAIKSYQKFKDNAKGKSVTKLNVDREIAMCKNGESLLSIITDVIVLDRKTLNEEDFFRQYDLSSFGGRLIVKPEEFMSDYEKKKDINSVMYLPDGDARVYFSRIDDPTKGGSELYFADKKADGSFGVPVKMPAPVNSAFDDAFPFMHPNGTTLYFSSKGHNSMGGYDIFRSFYNTETRTWSEPVNLDFAINTPSDDYLFITDANEKTAFFSSNRLIEAGKVNVYRIEMERQPLDFAVVKGNFKSSFTSNAKITVQNTYDNSIVAEVVTDAKGNYKIEVPNTGKFRFLVEADKSPVTHSGVVELKGQDALTPVNQQMEIIGQGDGEQLVIKNLIGEEVPAGEKVLTADMLKKRARLDVNKDRPRAKPQVTVVQAAEADKTKVVQQNEATITTNNADLSALSNAELLEVAKTDAVKLTQEANDLFAKSAVAMQIAEAKNKSARDKKAQANERAIKLQTAGGDDERKAIQKLRDEAIIEKAEAEAAFNLAKELEISAKRKQKEAQDAGAFAEVFEETLDGNPTEAQTQRLRQIKDSLTAIHADVQITDGDITYRNVVTAKNVEQSKLAQLNKDLAELDNKITENKKQSESVDAELLSAKGDVKDRLESRKAALTTERQTLDAQRFKINQDLSASEQKLNDLNAQQSVLESILAQIGSDAATTFDQAQVAQLDQKISDFEANDFDKNNFEQDLPPADTEAMATDAQSSNASAPKLSANPEERYKFTLPNTNSATESDAASSTTQDEDPAAGIDPFVDLAEAPFATSFLDKITAAEYVPGGAAEVAVAKGEIYDQWYQKVDNEIFVKKAELKKTKKEPKKQELQGEINILETQRENLKLLANSEYSKAISGQQAKSNGGAAPLSTSSFNAALESQSLGNILNSSYHKVYADEFAASVDIENDFVRAFKARDINKQWLNEVEAEVASLNQQKMQLANRQEQRLIEERIDNLNQFRNVKLKELAANEQLLAQLANEPYQPVSKASQSPTYAKIDELSRESYAAFKTALILRDSAANVSDQAAAQQALDQATLYENRAYERMLEVSQLTKKANEFQASNSTSRTVRGSAPIDRSALLASASNSPSPGRNDNNKNALPVADYGLNAPALLNVPNNEALQNQAAQLEGERADLVKKMEAEADPAKKAELKQEISLIDFEIETTTNAINARVAQENQLASLPNSVLSYNPQTEQLPSQKMFKAAEINYQIARDSLGYATFLQAQAEQTTDASEKAKLEKEATIVSSRAKARMKEADVAYTLAAELAAAEGKAMSSRPIVEANVSSSYPDLNAQLSPSALANLPNTGPYQTYKVKNDEATKQFKDAYVAYASAQQLEMDGYKKLQEAAVLYQKAAEAATEGEREELSRQAQALELAGKSDLKQAAQLKIDADKIYQAALGTQAEAKAFVDAQSPEVKEAIVAYEKAKYEGNLPKLIPQIPLTATNNQSPSNAPIAGGSPTKTQQPSAAVEVLTAASEVKQVVNAFYTDLPSSPYSEDSPIPLDPPMPLGIVYKVQIGAFKQPIPQNTFGPFAPLSAQKLDNGLTRYYAGLFPLLSSANSVKDQIRAKGYPDAFVVAFLNGKRIPIYEARLLEEELGATAQFTPEYQAQLNAAYKLPSGTNSIPADFQKQSGAVGNNKSNTSSNASTTTAKQEQYNYLSLSDVDGMFYTVQVGVYAKRKPNSAFPNVQALIEVPSNGLYRYNSGIYADRAQASADKQQLVNMGFKDAFVTAYFNGQRIYAGDAQQIQSEEGPQILASPWASFDTKTPEKYKSKMSNRPASTSNTSGGGGTVSGGAKSVAPKKDMVVFKVQVGAYTENIAVNQAKALLALAEVGVDIEKRDNLTIYRVGNYTKHQEAQSMRLNLIDKGFKDAFVVAYKNGNKIDLQSAIQAAKNQ